MSSRQDNFHGDHVVLLDNDGNPIGTAPRLEVHTTETPLHLAFSTYLFNSQGELLLTRRALSKRTWPGVWTNSCCGHPKKGEDISRAARRRIKEELGLNVGPLTEVLPDFRYTATDASGIVENEICPVFAGFVTDEIPEPDPNEVMDVLWVPWADLVSSIEAVPALYSPWAVLQVAEMGADMPKIISPAQNSPDLTAALADVEQLIQAEITKLSRKWRSFNTDMGIKVLPYDFPDWLDNLLIGKGKRLRVMMSYWGFIAAGGRIGSTEYQNMLKAAAALEILHLFALVHDDVMDESDSRRGQPSAHIQASSWHNRANAIGDGTAFGRNLAILLGDLAHTAADALIDELPATLRNFWYELCIELIVGQRCDLVGAAAARKTTITNGSTGSWWF
ncbi:MAG: hypothetical protein CSA83_00330 [Actinomycetales bacterium]|nr:MAG: hypothetical protein CSA83_00330 [Actinomycetales bacterium]